MRLPAVLTLLLLAGCAPGTLRPEDDDDGSGGASDEGGSGGRGGRGGSGGKASGGSGGKAGGGSGGTEPGEGGSGGKASGGSGGTASGGSGGKASGGSGGMASGGSGGMASGGSGPGDECPKTNPPGFCSIQLYLVNCIFCHTGAANQKRVNLSEGPGLRERLVNKPAVAIEVSNCPVKTLIVPGKPEESLLYLKIAGTMPEDCGKLMPDKESGQKNPPPPFTPAELKLVFDWIKGGAAP